MDLLLLIVLGPFILATIAIAISLAFNALVNLYLPKQKSQIKPNKEKSVYTSNNNKTVSSYRKESQSSNPFSHIFPNIYGDGITDSLEVRSSVPSPKPNPPKENKSHITCVDRWAFYEYKSPERLLQMVPQNSYSLLLSDYYEKYNGFYNFFKRKIESRSLMPLGAYCDNFYDWFRGVMAEKENSIIVTGIIDKTSKIQGTLIESALNDYYYICEEHLPHFYKNAFDLLRRCRSKDDYSDYYQIWVKSLEKAVIDGRTPFAVYVNAIGPNENYYIPVEMFFKYVNINTYITFVGEAYIDELQDLICNELNRDYKETNVNFLYRFGNPNVMNDCGPSVDTLCYYWPNNIDGISFTHNTGPTYSYVQAGSVNQKETRQLIKKCENIIRNKVDLPLIGEGWISETVLFRQIESIFENEVVEKHASPIFLGMQHYDVYLPDYKVALEYQGIQHYEPVDIFGGEEGLKRTQERDKKKRDLSNANRVTLIEVMPDYNIEEVVQKICTAANLNNPFTEETLNESIEIEKRTRGELKSGKEKLKKISRKKEKTYTAEEKQKARDNLLSIKSRFNEGYWVKLWYTGYQISNADLLDLGLDDIEKILIELKSEKSKPQENEKASYGDVFKRGINYYKKKGMYEKAIELTHYAIDNSLILPEKTKSFEARLEELYKKKEK